MAIPESQLETWSHQGSVAQSAATYNTIKNVLESSATPYAGKTYSVFLQGSYRNDTNIYAESDVDIIIKLDDTWYQDLSNLTSDEQDKYHKAYGNATYTYNDFKRDVLKVLTDSYGRDVKSGDKAIAISASGGRRKADVIAAAQFRRYFKFNGIYDQSYEEGICFFNAAGDRIANYPKQHSANLTRRHQDSGKWLKPMVRILKNVRSKLVEKGVIKNSIAPSYYLEGLLYNVPATKFSTSYQDCFANAVNWIQDEADKSKLVCANEQYYLLWDGSHTSWPKANCETFLAEAIKLWNNW